MTTPDDLSVQVGVGRNFGQHPRSNAGQSPSEAFIDAAVVSWCPPYAAQVAAIQETLRRDAQADFDAATAQLIVANPASRDTVAPAQWRTNLRVTGFLAAASTVAGFAVALGLTRGSMDPIDASTAAILVGISSALALCLVGSSLLFPSRMGRPGSSASLSLWLAAAPALGAVGVLPLRKDTWDSSTPVWWVLTAVVGVALLVLASIVTYARRRRADEPKPIEDDDVQSLRVSVLTAALDRAVASTQSAWHQLDSRTRAALEHERADAIDALQVRNRGQIDGEWLRSTAPGVLGLPYAADELHRNMSMGAAQQADRAEPGRFGYFVKRSRRRPPVAH